jgi:hypothetical protein
MRENNLEKKPGALGKPKVVVYAIKKGNHEQSLFGVVAGRKAGGASLEGDRSKVLQQPS